MDRRHTDGKRYVRTDRRQRVVTCLRHWARFIHEETPSIPP
ncbi:hypothetical protein SM2011_a6350 (plasmid) [Sinorhizobium meliloti 2011]|nr:hypothetical protein SM2011_a6350 [Sinorhizobium meliloti 2011]